MKLINKVWEEHWEWVFFKNLIGAIIFFPLARSVSFFLESNYNIVLLLATSLSFLFVSWIFSLRKERFLLPLALSIFLSTILFGWSVWSTSPSLVIWFICTTLAVLTFGFILARHLFRKTEKLLIKKWKEILAASLLSNFLRWVWAFAFLVFPLPLLTAVFSVAYILIVARYGNFA